MNPSTIVWHSGNAKALRLSSPTTDEKTSRDRAGMGRRPLLVTLSPLLSLGLNQGWGDQAVAKTCLKPQDSRFPSQDGENVKCYIRGRAGRGRLLTLKGE